MLLGRSNKGFLEVEETNKITQREHYKKCYSKCAIKHSPYQSSRQVIFNKEMIK